jgi:hypothetical protein
MSTEELLFLVIISFNSLAIPLTASGILRWRQSEMGPVQLMGRFSAGAGGVGIVAGILAYTGILPTAFLLLLFSVSFGLGAWSLGAFLDKSGKRLPDYVMLFWIAIAGTLLATRAFL